MADLLFIAITVAFFALAAAFVRLCDTIIGPDSDQGPLSELGEPDGAAGDTDLVVAGGPGVNVENILGLVVSVLIVAYLVLTLIFPEKF